LRSDQRAMTSEQAPPLQETPPLPLQQSAAELHVPPIG
jgi:hypothetical protein